jgi:hypothetical protein
MITIIVCCLLMVDFLLMPSILHAFLFSSHFLTYEYSPIDLTEYKHWEEEIDRWQTPIVRDERLPEW